MTKQISARRVVTLILMAVIGAAGALGVRWILTPGERPSLELGLLVLLGGSLGVLSAVVAFAWQDRTGWFAAPLPPDDR